MNGTHGSHFSRCAREVSTAFHRSAASAGSTGRQLQTLGVERAMSQLGSGRDDQHVPAQVTTNRAGSRLPGVTAAYLRLSLAALTG